MRLRAPIVAVALSIVAVLGARVAYGQVTLLGTNAVPHAISSDGATVVGALGNQQTAFRWTAAAGRYDFGFDAGMPTQTSASAVSADGTHIAVGSNAGPFRWSGPGTSLFTGGSGTATGISADGSKMVWWDGPITGPFSSFYWREGVGVQTIPVGNARATGLSRDGGVVAGTIDGGGDTRAFTWTPTGGTRVLPNPSGATQAWRTANAINFDGTIVVGTSSAGTTVWRNELPSILSVPSGWGFDPTCLSDDGNVVAGAGLISSSPLNAMIWTPARGTELFTTYLSSYGISFPAGYRPNQIAGVSSDGRTFIGTVVVPGQAGQGFIVTVPSPSGAAVLGIVALLATRRRRCAQPAQIA